MIPEDGPGVFDVAPAATLPHNTTPTKTYRVEVERGLPFAAAGVAELVQATLEDPRGWAQDPAHRLRRVTGHADIRVVLATPSTVDELCAPLETAGRLSCRNGANVVLNAWRWQHGAKGYDNVTTYRRYVINHEVGHALGHPHADCPTPGDPAPVMLQQTKSLNGCLANPWPTGNDLAPTSH